MGREGDPSLTIRIRVRPYSYMLHSALGFLATSQSRVMPNMASKAPVELKKGRGRARGRVWFAEREG